MPSRGWSSVLPIPFSVPVMRKMALKECNACGGPIQLPDWHEACILCLGCTHTEMALDGPGCNRCCGTIGDLTLAHLYHDPWSLCSIMHRQSSPLQQSPQADLIWHLGWWCNVHNGVGERRATELLSPRDRHLFWGAWWDLSVMVDPPFSPGPCWRNFSSLNCPQCWALRLCQAAACRGSHCGPPQARGWKSKALLPFKPCQTTANIVEKVFVAERQAASALHSTVVLQVLQAKLLKKMKFRIWRYSGSYACLRTQLSDILRWLPKLWAVAWKAWWLWSATCGSLSRRLNNQKRWLLNSPVSPQGLFGDAMGSLSERFLEAKK